MLSAVAAYIYICPLWNTHTHKHTYTTYSDTCMALYISLSLNILELTLFSPDSQVTRYFNAMYKLQTAEAMPRYSFMLPKIVTRPLWPLAHTHKLELTPIIHVHPDMQTLLFYILSVGYIFANVEYRLPTAWSWLTTGILYFGASCMLSCLFFYKAGRA